MCDLAGEGDVQPSASRLTVTFFTAPRIGRRVAEPDPTALRQPRRRPMRVERFDRDFTSGEAEPVVDAAAARSRERRAACEEVLELTVEVPQALRLHDT